MGHKFEVYIFDPQRFNYVLVYGGRSVLKAIQTAVAQKIRGIGTVKVEWR